MSEASERGFSRGAGPRLARSAGLLAVLVALAVATMAAAAPAAGTYQAYASLRHEAHGTAQITWSAGSNRLMVTMRLTGLAPNSTHPAHIHTGSCTQDGPVLYPLANVVANASGIGTSTTTVSGVGGGIPAQGWYINVHNGPGLSPAVQYEPIACGNVFSPWRGVDSQMSRVWLGAASDPDQHAWGGTQLWIDGDALVVRLWLGGLAPNSRHAAHIHDGSCAYQGGIAYPLNTVVADGTGDAQSTTVIRGVRSIPTGGWYVNVHKGTDLSTQTGFDPIACGNIYPS